MVNFESGSVDWRDHLFERSGLSRKHAANITSEYSMHGGESLSVVVVLVVVAIAVVLVFRLPTVFVGGLALAAIFTGRYLKDQNRGHMEAPLYTGGQQATGVPSGRSLFSRLVTTMGPQSGKSGLQRARNFLEKKALGALGVRGFGMEAVDIMEKGVNEKAGDAQILARLRAAWWRHPPKKPANQEGRAQARIKEGAAYFEQERAAAKAPGYRYLDVGCSEGSITAAVVAELGLSPEQAIATDVAFQTSPEGKLIASPAFLFVQVDGSSLPFDDATFDLITMYMSAHHFADARAMFAEAARVAKPGARLILREHGRADPAASLFYDFAHAFYETVAGEESTPEEFAARYARGTYAIYRPLDGWTRLAAVAGFKATDWIPPLKDTFDTLLIRFVREK